MRKGRSPLRTGARRRSTSGRSRICGSSFRAPRSRTTRAMSRSCRPPRSISAGWSSSSTVRATTSSAFSPRRRRTECSSSGRAGSPTKHYGPGMDAATPHFFASVTKSVLGLVAGVLAGRGVLATDRPVTDWIPEVAETAWAGATLRDLLDMRAGILFDEDYLATSGAIIEYRKAQGWDPLAPGEDALGPSNLVPEPHRAGRPPRRRLPLRLAQHRSPRLGDRAGGRSALHGPRERAPVAADGSHRRCVHHRRPSRCAPGRWRHVRDAPRSRPPRAARRKPRPPRREAGRSRRLDRRHPDRRRPGGLGRGRFRAVLPGHGSPLPQQVVRAARRCPARLRRGGVRSERVRGSGERDRDRQDVVAGAAPRRAPHRAHHARPSSPSAATSREAEAVDPRLPAEPAG